MGRKAKPGEAKAAAGNPGKRALNKSVSDQLKALGFEPPRGMSAAAKRVWNLLAPDLIKINFLKATDTFAFQRYCSYVAEWVEAEKSIRKDGPTYWTETRHGNMQRINPFVTVRDKLEGRLEKLEANFGLTTRDRQTLMQQLSVLPKQDPPGPGATPDVDGTPQAPVPAQPELMDQDPLGMLNQSTRH